VIRPLVIGTALSAALIGVLVLPGCGASGAKRMPAVSRPSTGLHDAIAAPKTTELRNGMTIRVRRSILSTVGWQVACIGHGRRVTAEGIRGQHTGSGEITGFKGGSPSIWVTHESDGSITVTCR
jgi:hypothetical protein